MRIRNVECSFRSCWKHDTEKLAALRANAERLEANGIPAAVVSFRDESWAHLNIEVEGNGDATRARTHRLFDWKINKKE